MGRRRFRRTGHALAAAGLAAAAVPLTLRFVPSAHAPPRVSIGWDDRGTVVREAVERWGFDRYGYVHQSRLRQWEAPVPAGLDAVRRGHAAGAPPDLWPTQSWRLQLTSYGANHANLPGGVTVGETGVIETFPYSLTAWMCVTPAAAGAVRILFRRWHAREMAGRRV